VGLRTGALAIVVALAAVVTMAGCRSTPREAKAEPPAVQCRNPQLEALGEYARTLQQQNGTYLAAEKSLLESAPASAERDLRLALVLGQPASATYDPEGAARLLAQVSASADADPASKAVADTLLTGLQGGSRDWTQSDEFRELTAQLSVEQQKRQETAARLESVRQQLDAERAQREKLEQQLEALKSLEEQIKNRDAEPGR
jgi:DNA repair exonuclease SbcCD ATPase subunit